MSTFGGISPLKQFTLTFVGVFHSNNIPHNILSEIFFCIYSGENNVTYSIPFHSTEGRNFFIFLSISQRKNVYIHYTHVF